MPAPAEALPGRAEKMEVPDKHFVNGARLEPPFPAGAELATFGLGCFWGAEKKFWQQPGVYSTAVGYAGGTTPNPTYREVCSGLTGHTEVVQVVFDPKVVSYGELLRVFWESHDPTQGMRQGNDIGTQYRSSIYTHGDAQGAAAIASRDAYAPRAREAGFPRRSRPRSPRRPRSFTPRTTTSSTSRRTRTVTADWAAPACRVRSASASARRAELAARRGKPQVCVCPPKRRSRRQSTSCGGKEPDDRGRRVRPRGDRARPSGQTRGALDQAGDRDRAVEGAPRRRPAETAGARAHQLTHPALRRARLRDRPGTSQPARAVGAPREPRANRRQLQALRPERAVARRAVRAGEAGEPRAARGADD